jgi:membrane protease YdiL (CAAX protease family)
MALLFCWLLWTGLFLWCLAWLPPSPLTPMLAYQLLTLLLIAWFVRRFGTIDAAPTPAHWSVHAWLLLAVFVGLLFWLVDHWLMTDLMGVDQDNDIKRWHAANQSFNQVTVLLSTVLLAPWVEEWLFRGCLLRGIQPHMPTWLAAIISAILFALIHWQWPAFISLFLAGCLYAWLTLHSGRLWPAVVAHVTHNALTFGLYSLA